MNIVFEKMEDLRICRVGLIGENALIAIPSSSFRLAAEKNNMKDLLLRVSRDTQKYSSYRRSVALTLQQVLLLENRDFPFAAAGFERVYWYAPEIPPETFEAACKEIEKQLGVRLDVDLGEPSGT